MNMLDVGFKNCFCPFTKCWDGVEVQQDVKFNVLGFFIIYVYAEKLLAELRTNNHHCSTYQQCHPLDSIYSVLLSLPNVMLLLMSDFRQVHRVGELLGCLSTCPFFQDYLMLTRALTVLRATLFKLWATAPQKFSTQPWSTSTLTKNIKITLRVMALSLSSNRLLSPGSVSGSTH